jgi:hypothetical protein
VVATLKVLGWTEADGSLGPGLHAVAGCSFLMDLAVDTKREREVFLKVQGGTSEKSSGADGQIDELGKQEYVIACQHFDRGWRRSTRGCIQVILF